MKELDSNKLDQIASEIRKEVIRAMVKHPNWPTDIIHWSAIVAEESGELTRASLQFVYEGGSLKNCKTEAIQTAAMAIRFLMNLPGGDFESFFQSSEK